MAITKIIDGKEYVFVTRRNILTTARKVAEDLRKTGKDARVVSINPSNHDVYMRKVGGRKKC